MIVSNVVWSPPALQLCTCGTSMTVNVNVQIYRLPYTAGLLLQIPSARLHALSYYRYRVTATRTQTVCDHKYMMNAHETCHLTAPHQRKTPKRDMFAQTIHKLHLDVCERQPSLLQSLLLSACDYLLICLLQLMELFLCCSLLHVGSAFCPSLQ